MYKKLSLLALQCLTLMVVAAPLSHLMAQNDLADRGRESNYDLYDRNRERLDFNPYDYHGTREDVYDRDYFYQGQDNYSPSNQYYNDSDYYYYQR